MSTVRDILATKGTQVWTIGKHATVLQAACFMNEHKVGALVVLEQGQVAGMFTERDVLRRVVGEQRDPATTPVADVMTTDVFVCTPATTIEEARGSMRSRRIRHLPVVDGDSSLLGLISIGDLNAHESATKEQTIHLLHEYLYGRV
jgi:CBS domain-containing protein